MARLSLQTDDSGLASYVANQIDRSLSWKVRYLCYILHLPDRKTWEKFLKFSFLPIKQDMKWLQTITSLPILVKGVLTAEDSKQS